MRIEVPESEDGMDAAVEQFRNIDFKKDTYTVGSYLAYRLQEIRINDVFTVPGDFNLILLDELMKNPNLRILNCCNELNAGYAADGYGRARGVGCLCVTYTVGTLAACCAIAGAYAEHVPLVVISGSINSQDLNSNRVVHHAISSSDANRVMDMMKSVTAFVCRISHPDSAAKDMDHAIAVALRLRRPVYIEICCNVADCPIGPPAPIRVDKMEMSNEASIQTSVEEAWKYYMSAKKPVILLGPHITEPRLLMELLHAFTKMTQTPVVLQPNARFLLNSMKPRLAGSSLYIPILGTYWGPISSPSTLIAQLVDSADMVLALGASFNDFTTCGYADGITKKRMIWVQAEGEEWGERRMRLPDGREFPGVLLVDFMKHLVEHAAQMSQIHGEEMVIRDGTLRAFKRSIGERGWYGCGGDLPLPNWVVTEYCSLLMYPKSPSLDLNTNPGTIGGLIGYQEWLDYCPDERTLDCPLENKTFQQHLQAMLSPFMSLIVDTGDSWFISQRMLLPDGCGCEMQGQFGAIGWSLGAIFGYCQSSVGEMKRVVGLLGDGACQVSVQEIGSMLRYEQNPIIFVLNNKGYATEEQVHSGPFNYVQAWKYSQLVNGLHGGHGSTVSPVNGRQPGWGCVVKTEAELMTAIQEALQNEDQLCLIEVLLENDDCTPELLEFGTRVSHANQRRP